MELKGARGYLSCPGGDWEPFKKEGAGPPSGARGGGGGTQELDVSLAEVRGLAPSIYDHRARLTSL